MSVSASWTAASEVSTIVPNEEEGWGDGVNWLAISGDGVNWLAISIDGATSFAGITGCGLPEVAALSLSFGIGSECALLPFGPFSAVATFS